MPNSVECLTPLDGEKLKKKIRAYAFVECSAKDKVNLQNVFDEAILAVKKKSQFKNKYCRIL